MFSCESDNDKKSFKIINKKEVALNYVDTHQIDVESEDKVTYTVELKLTTMGQ